MLNAEALAPTPKASIMTAILGTMTRAMTSGTPTRRAGEGPMALPTATVTTGSQPGTHAEHPLKFGMAVDSSSIPVGVVEEVRPFRFIVGSNRTSCYRVGMWTY
jgi:hypothetical protein